MNGNIKKIARVQLLLFLLSMCVVAGFHAVISVRYIFNPLDKSIKDINQVIEQKNIALSQCQKGTLSQKEIHNIQDEDGSSNILSEIAAFKENITEPIQTNNKHMDVKYSPNLLRIIDSLKPKATIINKDDISRLILDDYPYMEHQLPNVLLDEPYGEHIRNVYVLLRQGDSIKLVCFENKQIKYEMHILDSFSVDKILDGEGRVQAALYIVPPPTKENAARPNATAATGCDVPHYLKIDCDVWGDEIKLRFADGTTYYYDGDWPNKRSSTPHKQN